ncbi:hypothetical protein RKD26_004763 [Streptomyces calvus]
MSISSISGSCSRTADRWWKAAVTRESGSSAAALLGGAALLRLERVGALLVEAERVDAVDDELAGQFRAQGLQGRAVAVPGHGDDDDVAAPGRLGVVGALDAVPEFLRGGPCAFGRAGADDHLLAGLGEPVREALALRSGAAEHADDQPGDVGQVPGVLGGGLRGLLCTVGRGHGPTLRPWRRRSRCA